MEEEGEDSDAVAIVEHEADADEDDAAHEAEGMRVIAKMMYGDVYDGDGDHDEETEDG